MPSPRSTIALLVSLIACMVVHASAQGQSAVLGEDPSRTELGFVTFEIPSILRQEINARFAGDTLLIPFTAVANLLNIVYNVSPNYDTVYAELPLRQGFRIVRSSAVVVRPEKVDTLKPGSIRLIDDEIYFELGALSKSLRLAMTFSLETLQLNVAPDRRIPTVQRARNEDRYEAVRAANEGDGSSEETELELERSLFGSVILDWNANSAVQEGRTSNTGSIAAHTPFLYGVLTARGSLQVDHLGELRGAIRSYNWQLSLPEVPAIQSIALGFSPGRNVGGVSVGIGNTSPLDERTRTDSRTIDGTTEPGWDVELYSGQDLLDAVHVDSTGEYSFEVPMLGSTVTRTLVFVGPNGERISEERTLQSGGGVIPVGMFSYRLNAYTYGISDSVPVGGNVAAQYGVTDRLTLGINADVRAPYAGALAPDSVTMTLRAAMDIGDRTPVALRFSPRSGDLAGTIRLSPFDGVLNVSFDSLHVVRRTIGLSAATGVTIGKMSLAGGARFYNYSDRTGYEFNPMFFVNAFGVGFNASLRYMHEDRHLVTEFDPKGSVTKFIGRAGINFSPLRRVSFRAGGSYDFADNRVLDVTTSLSVPLVGGMSLDLSYSVPGLDWEQGRFGAHVGFRLPFASGSLYSTYFDDEVTATGRMAGSVALSSGGIDVRNRGNGSSSALIMRGFFDRNHNGAWDSGEESLGPVQADLYQQNGERIATGDEFHNIAPYRECVVLVEHNQFADSALYPRRSRFRMALMPASVEVIDVPFDEGRDVSGTCRIVLAGGRDAKPTVMLGAKISLVAIDGSAQYNGEFFQDGTCLFFGVAPGEYRFVLSDSQLRYRHLEIQSMPQTVVIDSSVEVLPEIVLQPRTNENAPSGAGEGK
jgi:hypothetical protein